jgi:hypothetical protein
MTSPGAVEVHHHDMERQPARELQRDLPGRGGAGREAPRGEGVLERLQHLGQVIDQEDLPHRARDSPISRGGGYEPHHIGDQVRGRIVHGV